MEARPVALPSDRAGLWCGIGAVVLWSFGSTFVYLGAKAAGTWTFIALGSFIAAGLQFLFRGAQTGELRSAVLLPWRLWIGPVACFVAYGLVWPSALASSTPAQVLGTNLLNYLWPILTVLFSVFIVPGMRLTGKTVLALGLALTGLILANADGIPAVVHNFSRGGTWKFRELLPYTLGLTAAVTWAVYSVLLARWRSWSNQYVTSPIGFLVIGVIGTVVLVVNSGKLPAIGGQGLIWTLLYGAGPLAAGYLLWEFALARARVQALGVIAAGTPILSTLILCAFLRQVPNAALIVAAMLVSVGVILSRRS